MSGRAIVTVLRGIFVLGVLGYLAGMSGTLMALLLLGVLLGAARPVGRPSPPKKRPVIAAPAGGLRPKLRRVK